jgi:hypothetical protein
MRGWVSTLLAWIKWFTSLIQTLATKALSWLSPLCRRLLAWVTALPGLSSLLARLRLVAGRVKAMIIAAGLGRILFSPWLWGGLGALALVGYIYHAGAQSERIKWANMIDAINSDIRVWQQQLIVDDVRHGREIDKAVADATSRIASQSKGPQCSIESGVAKQITTIAGVK